MSQSRANAVLAYAKMTCHTDVRELMMAAYFHEHDGKYIPPGALEEALEGFDERGEIPAFLEAFLGGKIDGVGLSTAPEA